MVTRRSDIAGRLEPVAFGIVLALHLVPVWSVHYFPTQDGPAHVYNTAQLLTLLAGDPLSSRYYATNLHPFPNWATTVLFGGFLRIVSPVTAEKIVVSLYVLGLPLSTRYLLTGRRAGAGWLAWLALPLVYNDFLHRGFYNFLLGIVVMSMIGAAVRMGSAAVRGGGEIDERTMAALHDDVVSRVSAEHNQSIGVRVREMFQDMRLDIENRGKGTA